MAASQVFEVFFTGNDDPRHGCIVIGEDTKPIFFRFETPDVFTTGDSRRTTIYRNAGEVVAWLDWTAGNHLGFVTIANRQQSMTHFVMHGSTPNSRVFLSANGCQYEWRKCDDDPNSYDLCRTNMARIAAFRRYNQDTPVGPSYAFMSYLFDNDLLLLEALVALCINRWIDWQGM